MADAEAQSEEDIERFSRCFVASPARPTELLTGLSEAIESANARGELQYSLWTKNDISGRDLVQPIQENISRRATTSSSMRFRREWRPVVQRLAADVAGHYGALRRVTPACCCVDR